MKRNFWNIVPRPAKVAAYVIIGLGVLIGLVVGIVHPPAGNLPAPWNELLGTAFGFLFCSMAALWVLCLGYVYADARRRAMPPIPWTLIAAFVPNLLGFLFYFALRRPLLRPCPRCAQAMYIGQRFCASCGFDTFPAAPSTAPAPSPYIG